MSGQAVLIRFGVAIISAILARAVVRGTPSQGRAGDLSPATGRPNDVYLSLRRQAFETDPMSIGMTLEPDSDEPWGILMEMGFPRGIATLVSFATGDASLYFSTGGGVLGGVADEGTNNAARRFVSTAQRYIDRMENATSCPLPDWGQVKFYVLMPQGVLTTEASGEDLGKRRSVFSPLFYAGQDVLAGLRIASQRGSR